MHYLLHFALFMSALLTGSLVLLGAAMYPYWLSLDVKVFSEQFAQSTVFIASIMKPLGLGTTFLICCLTAVSVFKRGFSNAWLIASACCVFAMAVTYPAFFKSANALLASDTLAVDKIP